MNSTTKKELILISSLIGLCFFWTSCGYLSWLYHLSEYATNNSLDILTEVVGYVFQALGLLTILLYTKKHPSSDITFRMFLSIVLVDYLLILLSVVSGSLPTTLIFGYLMNYFHGQVAALYLYLLTEKVQNNRRGICFGLGYGIASILSWVISLPMEHTFLRTGYVLIVYAFLCALSISIAYFSIKLPSTITKWASKEDVDVKLIYIVGITILLLTIVRGLGFFFPSADIASGISLEFSRVFYAIGLILSGLLIDSNRKNGAICCALSMVFPFLMLALTKEIGVSIVFWVMGYIFYGFFNVYRVVIFSDIASQKKELLFLAPLGLLIGRLGDAAGSLCGILLGTQIIPLCIIGSILFVITLLLFLRMYIQLYEKRTEDVIDDATRLSNFAEAYELSAREFEVLKYIYEGLSNSELSSKLFISENTVKFHVRNLLKKTNCENRVALIEKVKKS